MADKSLDEGCEDEQGNKEKLFMLLHQDEGLLILLTALIS
jgi:hypothetical protein